MQPLQPPFDGITVPAPFLFEQCFDFKIVCKPLEMKLSRKALENKWIYLMKVNKYVYKGASMPSKS